MVPVNNLCQCASLKYLFYQQCESACPTGFKSDITNICRDCGYPYNNLCICTDTSPPLPYKKTGDDNVIHCVNQCGDLFYSDASKVC